MQWSSSFAVILCTLLINQYIYCSTKRDEQWWKNLMSTVGTRQKNQWTTIDSDSDFATQASNRSVKRSSVGFDNFDSDSPVKIRSWEKSYARRRDFDRIWSDDQPLKERFSQTEWDDEVPVRHVFRDSISSIDEGPTRRRISDEIQTEKMSRPWVRGDWKPTTNRDNSVNSRSTFSSARNLNNNNENTNRNNNYSNNKPKSASNSQQPKTDRVLDFTFQDSDSKKKDRDRLDELAKKIFSMDNFEEKSVTTGDANGYVSNPVNGFTRNSGNSYVTTSGSNIGRNSGNGFNSRNRQTNSATVGTNKQTYNSNKFGTDLVKPSKPKFNTIFETTAKPVRSSNNGIEIKNVAEKPKISTTPSSQLGFGWRSSLSHTNDQKNSKLQNSEENEDFEDSDEDSDDTTTTIPYRPTTRTTAKPITRTTIRPTIRPTSRPTDYTTYLFSDTTRPQITSDANKASNELTFPTTSRPKATTSGLSDNLAPNKKQHRMGSWVDSDSLDYEEGDNPDLVEPSPQVSGPEPVSEEDQFDDVGDSVEDKPEVPVQEVPVEIPKFSRQSSVTGNVDYDQSGWRLEDALPGVPGSDYPTFATIPKTNFDCRAQEWPGYYADVETQCQVFHICQTGGRKNSFLCPNGTMFNQLVFVCDWWHNVQCGDSPSHYPLNENIYDNNWESKRVPTTESEGSAAVRRSGAIEESAEPITTDTAETDSESNDSFENRNDFVNDSNDFIDEEIEQSGKSSRIQSPIRIYRTSRIITPDRQKRRRRKRGHLKV